MAPGRSNMLPVRLLACCLAAILLHCRALDDPRCDPADPFCNAPATLLLLLDEPHSNCGNLSWDVQTASCWDAIQTLLEAEQSRGDCGAPTVQLIGDVFSVAQKWSSGVLVPSGNIHGVTQNQNQFLKITPAASTAVLSGGTNSNTGWRGGVLSYAGTIIGFSSAASGTMIEFDPNTETSFENTGVASTANGLRGGVLAGNGFIYTIPTAHTSILKIDPVNHAVTGIAVGGTGWEGATLGPDGRIYAAPLTSNGILVIDPADDSVRTIGSGFAGYGGAVLAPNRKIYFLPSTATSVLVLDPATETTYNFGSLPGGSEDWVHGAMAANGKIYSPPGNSTTTVLVIDTATETTTQIATGTVVADRWWGAVAAPNGKLYAIPFNATQVMEIDPCADGQIVDDILLGPFYNKW